MLMSMSKRPWLAVPILASLAVVSTGDLLAQSGGHRRSVVIAPSNPEDERDPVVFKRNLYSLTNRAVEVATQVGLAPETIQRMTDLRAQLDAFGDPEYAAAAQQIGPEIAQANRAMSRVKVLPAPLPEPDPQPFSGPGWAFDPGNVQIAPYPAFSFNVDDEANGQGNTSTASRICNLNRSQACSTNDDCAQGDQCIDRPTSANESHDVQMFSGCTARPSDSTIQNLAILAVVFEAIQMVADRICGQEWFGFNINLVCIITDLLFLFNRTLLDFEVMCADRWSDAENQASYDRLGHLHGDLDTFKLDVDNYFTSATGPISLLQDSVTNNFNATTNHLNLFETNVNNRFDTTNTNLDNSRTLIQTNIDNTRTTTNLNIDNTRIAIQNQLSAQNDQYLQAEIERVLLHRERLAIYYLPEAQGGHLNLIRQIVERTINNVEASREQTYTARTLLGYAITDINAGRYKRAFNYLSTAYFEAIKILGETQIQ